MASTFHCSLRLCLRLHCPPLVVHRSLTPISIASCSLAICRSPNLISNNATVSGMEAEKVLMDYYIPNYILLPRIEATVNHDLVTYLLVLSKCLSILKVVASLGVYDLRERAPDKVLHQLYSNLEKHKQNGDSLGKNPGTNCSSVKAFLDQVRNAKEMRVDSWHILMRLRAPTEGSCALLHLLSCHIQCMRLSGCLKQML
nr:diacylglycerol kinase 5-like [Ipomoea batatas]